MTIKELRTKTISELNSLQARKREDLRSMMFKVAQRQLKKVHDIKNTRRDIAKIMTALKEKQSLADKSN